MYSEEIKKLVMLRNNLVTIKDYLNIVDSSPQIDHIKYENDEFKLWTTDDYKFTLKINKGGINENN